MANDLENNSMLTEVQLQQASVTTDAVVDGRINVAKERRGKLIRRAFSMPRNPFRLSRRAKNATSSTIVETSVASVNGNDTTSNEHNLGNNDDACNQSVDSAGSSETTKRSTLPVGAMMENRQQKTEIEQDNKHRLFRRSAWKKFLIRIAQQLTSNTLGVS